MRGNCQHTEPRPTHAKLENNFITEFKPAVVVATYKMSLFRPQWFQGLFEGAIYTLQMFTRSYSGTQRIPIFPSNLFEKSSLKNQV